MQVVAVEVETPTTTNQLEEMVVVVQEELLLNQLKSMEKPTKVAEAVAPMLTDLETIMEV
jgi:hypothetical protein